MPYREFEGQNCSIARTLSVVGERWTLLILREVLLGRRRFEDIRRGTGVASNILTDRLETLVEHGVLKRRLYSEHPESYEYLPTRKALELNPVLMGLMEWGDRHLAGRKGAPRVAVHAACGHDAHAELHCSHCGELIEPQDVRVRPGPGANEEQRAEGVLPTQA